MSPVPAPIARRLFYRHRYRVTTAAACLAAIAGFVNGVAIALTDRPASHHTGSIARISQDLAFGRASDLRRALEVIAAFCVGAVISGAIVGTRRLLPGPRYGVVLIVEGVALATSAIAFAADPFAGVLLAAAACGLQNGMASNFYGTIVRTTHVSGLLTDLSVLAGNALRGRPVEGWRAAFQGSIVAGFVAGGVLGARAARDRGASVLFAPALICAAGGAVYVAWLRLQRPVVNKLTTSV